MTSVILRFVFIVSLNFSNTIMITYMPWFILQIDHMGRSPLHCGISVDHAGSMFVAHLSLYIKKKKKKV